jgi:small subunit ribosomal protein S17
MATNTASPKTGDTSGKSAKAQAARVGIVESDSRTQTRKVVLPNPQMHPKYGKLIRKRTVLHVHDEKNVSRTGDLVEIAPCTPVSKTKRWALVRVVRQGASMKFTGVDAPAKDGASEPAPAAAPAGKAGAKPAAKTADAKATGKSKK